MNQLVTLLLTAALLNGLSWIILVPIWQYPDEQAHFAQVQYIAETRSKVSDSRSFDTSREVAHSEKILGTKRDEFGNNKFTYHPEYKIEYSQNSFGLHEREISSLPRNARSEMVKNEATENPPTYYFLGSIIYKIFTSGDLFVRVFAIRFLSVILFLLTVFTAYKIGQLIFQKSNLLSLTLASLVAFKPMLVFSSTGVLPDTLTNLLFSVLLFITLKILLNGIKFRFLSVILFLVILGSLTRQQFLISTPIVAVSIIYQLLKNRKEIKNFVIPALILSASLIFLSFLIPQLSFIRNLSLPEVGRPDLTKLLSTKFIDHSFVTLKQTVAQTLPWYWGVYRWLSLTLPPIYYQIINRMIFIATVGLIIRAVFIIKNRKISQLDLITIFLIVSSLIYFLVILFWDYYFRLAHNFSFGIQGRYFFPLVIFHLAIILIGFKHIFKLILRKYANYGFLILALIMILFNDLSLWHVASSYYEAASIESFIVQASQYKPIIFKGNIILIILGISLLSQVIFLFGLTGFIIRENESHQRSRI